MRVWLVWMALLPAAGTAADPIVVGVCTHFGQGKGLLKSNLSMARQPTSSRNDEIPACRIIERFDFRRPLPCPKWVQTPTTIGSAAVPAAGNSAIQTNQTRM